MERKRKLPARAAARAEEAAKRRTMTPPKRSATPAPAPAPEPEPEPEPAPIVDIAPPLPKSITAGKPLPTVDSPQPDDLSRSDYQTVTERHGIFEKYWSKPTKKKGVVIEEPNNPPKESMTKIGQVTITVEPHVFEATMFAVKDPKPPAPPPPTAERPIIQYGPPNGTMPPPPTPTSKAMTPTNPSGPVPSTTQPRPGPVETKPPAPLQTPTQTPTLPLARPNMNQATPDQSRSAPPVPPMPARPIASPRGMEAVLSPGTAAPLNSQPSAATQPQPPRPTPPPNQSLPSGPTTGAPAGPRPATTVANNPVPNGTSATPAGATAKPAPGTDPIILMLAEKAGSDPQLRDLMKRVAQGEAAKHELERFQAIIDAITAESKRNGGTSGPSADRLLVDGRTVRYFADEVRAILDIVFTSNPKQTSADLRPPVGSDALVVMLVKTALDDPKTRDIVRRIAENKTQFADATDLKVILDGLRTKLIKEKERQQTQSPVPASPASTKPNGAPNGYTAVSTPVTHSPAPQTALRSKGPPPPPPKPDISALVFEFTGGTGDRYLFPKFSLLEYVPVPSGQQVIASFLLVRKGSKAEYPMADPSLDYYQPLTIRLFTHAGRHLEHLARVVAPPDEVRRYMDDVMVKMTRAEYILLAMRLPRRDGSEDDKENEREVKQLNGGPFRDKENGLEVVQKPAQQPPSVLWTAKPSKSDMKGVAGKGKAFGRVMDADDHQYQGFIASVSRKEV
ncbi:hypothetical protein CHGG_09811 [Chaetomium globosum CBS 148.51]|uniref:SWR1-complex protein 3 domain-containing protein n=1 Tax=Chaetomium globosum (strain ATCC 6205 / CBS 148.51 / DSM 1962 / NBRC 6347 / NRRL 1970) TaxID=306901 RepID=Q2GQE3_CHAGB|nr:uncharacterized protein CHGG_09811 [Chaetomium globosum CBS 148.51]EAQ83407.1 hypothetical protein CHGG_09811 [Chaetomium globosum CBS 148.51]